MTDPLSITAAIVGLAAVSTQVTSTLITFLKRTHNAPKQAALVLSEVRDLQGIIAHAHGLILQGGSGSSSGNGSDDGGIGGSTWSGPGASVVCVEHVVVIITGCVVTFSELEEVLGGLNTGDRERGEGKGGSGELDVLDCLKWARKEARIAVLTGRLQNHKASLTAMLSILGCSSQLEAKQSLDNLNMLVGQLVTANQDLFGRIREIELRQGIQPDDEPFEPSPKSSHSMDTSSDLTLTGEGSVEDKDEEEALNRKLEAAFKEDLESSRVYRRAWKDNDRMSQISGVTRATPWSMLSEMSLAEVSTVSVIALPIYSSEISNSQHYCFSDTANARVSGIQEPNQDFDIQLRTIMQSLNGTSEELFKPWGSDRWFISPRETQSRDADFFNNITGSGVWSKRFLRHLFAVWNVIFNALAFPEFKVSPRTLGVNGLRSLERAIQRVNISLGKTFLRAKNINSLLITGTTMTRLNWRLNSREKLENHLVTCLHRAQVSTVGVQMYLDTLQTCSVEEERDVDFHLKVTSPLMDPANAPRIRLPHKDCFALIEVEKGSSYFQP